MIKRGLILFVFVVVSGLSFVACEPTEILSPDIDAYQSRYGTIKLEFPIDDDKVPHRCIKRADISISYTADSLYRKEFIAVVNVSTYQHLYEISLNPGKYYYQAGKTCICGGDTCLWGGYSGGQNGMKWTMGNFDVLKNEISYDRLTFN